MNSQIIGRQIMKQHYLSPKYTTILTFNTAILAMIEF